MDVLYLLLASVAPVLVLLFYIYRKDALQPEPPKWLWKGFSYGVGSVFLSFCFSLPLMFALGLDGDPTSVVEAAMKSFFTAAIPEELAKLIMLWLLLRKNPFFDERIDGIVYAVCVGMGFACLENIMYVFENGLGNAVTRAFTAVPGHFFFAVVMGYFYSLFYFTGCKNKKTMVLILAAPIIAHGIYDTICFSSAALLASFPLIAILISLSLYVFIYKLGKYGNKRIAELQEIDRRHSLS